MKYNWEQKKIGDILFHDTKSLEKVSPSVNYPMVGVYSFGKGLFDKETLSGINTSYKNFYRLSANHIVMSQLFGWEGAIALSSPEFEGKYLSSQFPTFLANEEKVDRKFIGFYLQQGKIWKLLFAKGRGMGSRRRTLTPENLLTLEISLPPLYEQQYIVSKIEEVKTNLEQIKKLRAEQSKDINNLLFSKYTELIEDAEWLPMNEVAPIIRRAVELKDEKLYPELGIRCFGKGTFHKSALTGLEVATKKIFQIKTGDLVFSNVFAWEGGIAVAKEEDNDRYGSHRFISCVADKEKALTEFLCFHFLSTKGLQDINACSPGGAGRNKTLGLAKLMKIKVPVPDINLQNEFVELQHKVNAIKEHHQQTEKELNELMPALLDKAFKGEI